MEFIWLSMEFLEIKMGGGGGGEPIIYPAGQRSAKHHLANKFFFFWGGGGGGGELKPLSLEKMYIIQVLKLGIEQIYYAF